jgi:pyruvate dehydrogenase complex dehydrogenase (E1) component
MRDKGVGNRILPIIPDDARTFGTDLFFPTAKIYNPRGRVHLSGPVLLLAYEDGVDQIRQFLPNPFATLGAVPALSMLAEANQVDPELRARLPSATSW